MTFKTYAISMVRVYLKINETQSNILNLEIFIL